MVITSALVRPFAERLSVSEPVRAVAMAVATPFMAARLAIEFVVYKCTDFVSYWTLWAIAGLWLVVFRESMMDQWENDHLF